MKRTQLMWVVIMVSFVLPGRAARGDANAEPGRAPYDDRRETEIRQSTSFRHAGAGRTVRTGAILARERTKQFADGPERLTILGKSGFGRDTREFHALLAELGIPHRYSNDLRYKHRWDSGWVEPALDIFLGEPPQ